MLLGRENNCFHQTHCLFIVGIDGVDEVMHDACSV